MRKTLRRYQTTAPHCNGVLSLIGSEAQIFEGTVHDSCQLHKDCASSPYFQRSDEEEAPGQEYQIILDLMKAIYGLDYVAINGGNQYVGVGFFDMTTNPGTCTDVQNLQLDMADAIGTAGLASAAITAINTYATSQGYNLSDGIWPVFNSTDPLNYSSYQTVVSQTGTSAPAVAGGFTPANSYSGAPTFTWARASAGVYTITASSAVFTAGKTSVVLGSLNNLNASYKAVVTSSTVITITTAIGSLLGLGLLGLTATNTDALLTATQVTVQTYA